MTKQTRVERQKKAIADADLVTNLLEHAGWVDVIKPRLEAKVNELRTLLPQLVLSSGLQVTTGATKEQVAARIQGITEVIKLIENILRDGATAFEELNAFGKLSTQEKPR